MSSQGYKRQVCVCERERERKEISANIEKHCINVCVHFKHLEKHQSQFKGTFSTDTNSAEFN